jgi:hypothetical protein
MRTEFWIALFVAGALLVLVGISQWSSGTEPRMTQTEVPPDIERLGLDPYGTSAEGKIGRDEAVALALREHGPLYEGNRVDAYLGILTDPSTMSGALDGLAVWIVRISGLSLEVYGPATPNGPPVYGGTIIHAYIYLDAVTGEWVLTTQEGPEP